VVLSSITCILVVTGANTENTDTPAHSQTYISTSFSKAKSFRNLLHDIAHRVGYTRAFQNDYQILRQNRYVSVTCADPMYTHTHTNNTHTTAECSNKDQTQTVNPASQTVAGSSELGEVVSGQTGADRCRKGPSWTSCSSNSITGGGNTANSAGTISRGGRSHLSRERRSGESVCSKRKHT
jgi:hypothetical protein